MMMSDNSILVTVVIPAYNHGAYISQCIESVLEQGIQDLELIIIDDASSDNTAAIAEKYTLDDRVTLIRNENNLGSYANNSKAIRVGQGKYFVWLHGDDYLLPGHLNDALVRLEDNPHCDLAYSPCYWVDEQDRIIRLSQHPGHCLHEYAGGRNEVAELLTYDNYVTPSSAVMRRSALDKFTGFDINIRAGDWYLFVQLALNNSNFIFINRASTCYRIHEGQFSNEFYQSDKPLMAHIGILENVLINGQANRLLPWYTPIQEHLVNRISGYTEKTISVAIDRLKLIQNTMKQAHDDSMCRDMVTEPLVSIIIETRDNPEELHTSLASLAGQSYQNWEAIIVNNSGCDVSGLIDRFNLQDKLHYIQLERESSYSTVINAGLRFAKGEVISYLHTGETWASEHVQQVIKSMSGTTRHVVYSGNVDIHKISPSQPISMSALAHSTEVLGMVRVVEEGSRINDIQGFVQRLANIVDIYHLKNSAVVKNDAESPGASTGEAFISDRIENKDTADTHPLVSIIVPTYNRPLALKNALESIKAQDYQHWEVIVVNDAGEDVEQIVTTMDSNNRIRYFCHEHNKGLSAARNTGLKQVSGEIVCYLDDDDVFLPPHLGTLVNSLVHSDAGLVYTDSVHVLEEEENGVVHYSQQGNQYTHDQFSIERLHIGNFIPVNTFAHYRHLLDKVGDFDTELSALEDWDMLLRLSRVTKFQHIPVTTVEVRVRNSDIDNMSVRERKRYPILYREMYDRYDDLGNPEISEQRLHTIKHLDEMSQNLVNSQH